MQEQSLCIPPKWEVEVWGNSTVATSQHLSSSVSVISFKRETFVFQSKCWWFGLFLSQLESRGICCKL